MKKLPKCSICKQTKLPFQVIGNNKVICEDCLKECEHVQVDYVDMYIPKKYITNEIGLLIRELQYRGEELIQAQANIVKADEALKEALKKVKRKIKC